MKKFEQHKKEWFLNRVGEMVEREYTPFTPQSVRMSPMVPKINICSEKHAIACYNFHRDNKVNFSEINNATHHNLIRSFEIDLRK